MYASEPGLYGIGSELRPQRVGVLLDEGRELRADRLDDRLVGRAVGHESRLVAQRLDGVAVVELLAVAAGNDAAEAVPVERSLLDPRLVAEVDVRVVEGRRAVHVSDPP